MRLPLPVPTSLPVECRNALARLLVLAAVLGVGSCPVQAGNSRRSPVVNAVERVRAAVVNIHSERTVQGPAAEDLFAHAPSQNRVNGMGTGVLIDPRGYIVTNHHVVEDVNAIRVRLSDGTTYTARVLARDQESDLALLKIEARQALPVMPLGTASDLMVGETVVAIGNAFGYEHTVTMGVVSALKRDVTLNKEMSYKALIQTDASINPGNSGGPLLNINGEMIGVNVAIRAGAQGISFAIPVDTMVRVVADMMSGLRRNALWHGLICQDRLEAPAENKEPDTRKPTEAETVSMTKGRPQAEAPAPVRRLVVERIESASPAAQAGLKPGDVVVQVADVPITCRLDLERALAERAAGEHLNVVVRRQGEEKRFDLALQAPERSAPQPAEFVWRKLGLRVLSVPAEQVAVAGQQLRGGLNVTEVNAVGAAAKAGIQRGDILIGLHLWETLSVENILFVLNHPDAATFNPLCFYVVRSGQVRRGWLPRMD